LPDEQRILGIDPGSRLTGFGVIIANGPRAHYVTSGAVQSIEGTFPERLRTIFESVAGIVAEYQPDVIAVESVFMHRNAGSALKLGQARSAAICGTFVQNAKIHEYAPREIKQAVVGTGAATKDQINHMVRHLLNLDGEPSPDAADALAVALCYANQSRMSHALETASRVAGLK
jgi:crossover junction endodeoxyribonuclease RuvC